MKYKYKAQDKYGKLIIGQLSAKSASSLVLNLKSKGLLPFYVKELKSQEKKIGLKKSLLPAKKVSIKELAVFSREVSSSLSAGIPLFEALRTISEDLENRYFRLVLEDVVDKINSGSNFSEALSKYPHIFSNTFLSLIKAGETSGRLDITTRDLARYLEHTDRLIKKVKSSTRYPMFIVGFLILVVTIIVVFLIPKFKALFSQAGVSLPLLTRIVVGFSEFMLKNFLWVALCGVLVAVVSSFLLRSPKIRYSFDQSKFKIPLFGKIIKKVLLLRFSRTLSILVSGGVSLVTALPICGNVVNNLYLKNVIETIKNNVIAGASLSRELKNQPVFPRMFVKMVQVGEQTGKISTMLSQNADYYEEDLEITLNDLTNTIEPILIIAIGGVVLVVTLALYLPIFNMSMAVK